MKKSSNASNSKKCIITGSRFLITILIVMAMIILPIAYHFIFNASLINTSAFLQIVTNIFLVSGVVAVTGDQRSVFIKNFSHRNIINF